MLFCKYFCIANFVNLYGHLFVFGFAASLWLYDYLCCVVRFNPAEKKLRRSLLQHHMLGECIISGANTLHDVSLSDCGSFDELPGVHYVIPPGFETVVQILAQNVPAEAVHLNHVVTKVSFSDKNNPGSIYLVSFISARQLG